MACHTLVLREGIGRSLTSAQRQTLFCDVAIEIGRRDVWIFCLPIGRNVVTEHRKRIISKILSFVWPSAVKTEHEVKRHRKEKHDVHLWKFGRQPNNATQSFSHKMPLSFSSQHSIVVDHDRHHLHQQQRRSNQVNVDRHRSRRRITITSFLAHCQQENDMYTHAL